MKGSKKEPDNSANGLLYNYDAVIKKLSVKI